MNNYLSRTAKRALLLLAGLAFLCFFLPPGAWRLVLPLGGILLALVGGTVYMRWREYRPVQEPKREPKSVQETDPVQDLSLPGSEEGESVGAADRLE